MTAPELPPQAAAAVAGLTGLLPAVSANGHGPAMADPLAELWNARPVLRHLHTFARARGVAPLAVLGAVLARAVACVSPLYVLPPLVGTYASLNPFVALVGPSGAGKGAATGAGDDAVDLGEWKDPISGDPLHRIGVGSGEGLLHQYARRERNGDLTRVREAVVLDVPEVDTLTALGSRQGSTLLGELRKVYDGAALSFGYADRDKALTVRAHTYRASLLVGVQPFRAGPLLDGADGGLPQRFLWLPVTDPQMPRPEDRPAEPRPVPLALPPRPYGTQRHVLTVAEVVRREVTEAHWRRSRGDGDALDGHSLLTCEKVAAALAVLDGHLGGQGVTADDWHLAGLLMAESDRTREAVREALADRTRQANTARARAEAERVVVVRDTVEADSVKKASRAVKAVLRQRPGEWLTTKQLRAKLTSSARSHLADALAVLTQADEIEAEEITGRGRAGHRYRSRS